MAAPRERELGLRGGLRRQPIRPRGDLVRRQGQGLPARDPLLGRRRDEALWRGALSAAAPGLRGAAPPRRDLARVADLVRRDGALLHEGRAAVRGPRQPRRGCDRGPRQRAVSLPGPDPRAADPDASRTTSSGRAITRSTHRAAFGCWPTTPSPARASGAGRAMASRACSSPSPMPTSWVSARPSSTTTSRS